MGDESTGMDELQGRARRPRMSRIATLATLAAALAFPAQAQERPVSDSSFAAMVARLSEAGGYFDSDNIISNESSYLQIASQLTKVGTHGGIYIGVGPDQSFSYIALIRPSIAFMLDIRRDNMLEHLLFKSIFAQSRNRLEYLCRLFGKPIPADLDLWNSRPVALIIAYLQQTPTDSASVQAYRRASNDRITGFHVALDARDRAVIDRYRAEFVVDGL